MPAAAYASSGPVPRPSLLDERDRVEQLVGDLSGEIPRVRVWCQNVQRGRRSRGSEHLLIPRRGEIADVPEG